MNNKNMEIMRKYINHWTAICTENTVTIYLAIANYAIIQKPLFSIMLPPPYFRIYGKIENARDLLLAPTPGKLFSND